LALVTALGCGLSAGALLAFSSFVMNALARPPAAHGIAAVQSINVVAVTPLLMTALFGTAVACAALAVWALAEWHDSFGPWLRAGSALYLACGIANWPRSPGRRSTHFEPHAGDLPLRPDRSQTSLPRQARPLDPVIRGRARLSCGMTAEPGPRCGRSALAPLRHDGRAQRDAARAHFGRAARASR
jgi:hypothetical protein